nr:S8 family serine peptidase [Bacillus pakistanensis]
MKAIIAEQQAILDQEPQLHPQLQNFSEKDNKKVDVIVQLSEPPVSLVKGKKEVKGRTLSASEKKEVKREVKSQQEKFEQQLEKKDVNYEKGFEYNDAFNGMSLQLEANEVNDLLKMEGVVSIEPDLKVHALEKPERNNPVGTHMAGSIPHLQIPKLWEMGYEGQGVKVAVLDTGIDYHHPEFEGVYKGGYNFVPHNGTDYSRPRANDDPYETTPLDRPDHRPEINERGSAFYTSHGTHVAGTIAAQGKNMYNIKGVAPKIELYAYRVLGAYGSGATSGIIAAIEKSVEEGMDIINLSLGGSNNSQIASDSIAINNATLAGVTAVIATGNSGPNRSTIGNPSTAALGIAVGNSTLPEESKKANVKVEAGTYHHESEVSMMSWIFGNDPKDSLTGTYDVVAIPGVGKEVDFSDIDVNGKVALISRGEIPFVDKIAAAKKAGAVAAIIHNNIDGAGPANVYLGNSFDSLPTFDMATDEGKALREALGANPGTVTLSGYTSDMTAGDKMNPSSSRGPSLPVFDIKPDVSAPGTNIMSTVPSYGKDNPDADYSTSYDRKTGTSMATPHIAGIAALLKSMHPDWTPFDIKVALSNTAKQLDTDKFDVFAQGSGLVQPLYAATAEALAYSLDTTISESKVIENVKGTITYGKVEPDPEKSQEIQKQIKVKNLKGSPSDYQVSVEVTGKPAGDMAAATVTVDKAEFTLEDEQMLNVTLNVPKGEGKAGDEIQGYLYISNGTTNLSLPFAADLSPPILSGLKDYSIEDYAISPNGDGKLDQTTLNYEFHNEHGMTFIELWDASNPEGGKYGDGYLGYMLSANKTTTGPKSLSFDGTYTDWSDFTVKQAPEGVYTIDIRASNPLGSPMYTTDYVGPVFVKNSAPKITFDPVEGEIEGNYEVKGDIDDKFIDFKATVEKVFDGKYDVNDKLTVTYEVKDKDGNVVEKNPVALNQDGSFSFALTELKPGENTVTLNVIDAVQNTASKEMKIMAEKPEEPVETATIVVNYEDIADQLNDKKAKEVVITLPSFTDEIINVKAEMSNSIITTLEQSKKSVVFKADQAQVKVNKKVIKQLSATASEKVFFNVNLEGTEAIPVTAKGAVVSDAYEFSFLTETNGEVHVVNNLDHHAVIKLPVNETEVKHSKGIDVFDAMTLKSLKAKYKSGVMEFKTKKLSKFVALKLNKKS